WNQLSAPKSVKSPEKPAGLDPRETSKKFKNTYKKGRFSFKPGHIRLYVGHDDPMNWEQFSNSRANCTDNPVVASSYTYEKGEVYVFEIPATEIIGDVDSGLQWGMRYESKMVFPGSRIGLHNGTVLGKGLEGKVTTFQLKDYYVGKISHPEVVSFQKAMEKERIRIGQLDQVLTPSEATQFLEDRLQGRDAWLFAQTP
ncbi:MAG: hypothetical protein WCG27_04150, partial [Pseudomonadota bacterium]